MFSSCVFYFIIGIFVGEEFVLGEGEKSSFCVEFKNLSSIILNVRIIDKIIGE